jgi:hypothetical protein
MREDRKSPDRGLRLSRIQLLAVSAAACVAHASRLSYRPFPYSTPSDDTAGCRGARTRRPRPRISEDQVADLPTETPDRVHWYAHGHVVFVRVSSIHPDRSPDASQRWHPDGDGKHIRLNSGESKFTPAPINAAFLEPDVPRLMEASRAGYRFRRSSCGATARKYTHKPVSHTSS